ncbi:MAG: hypothetical protein R3D25_16200 [Geminicoccaceae bacterium]
MGIGFRRPGGKGGARTGLRETHHKGATPMRILLASAFALSVVTWGPAMAGPVTLGDTQLDGITAAFGGFSGIDLIELPPVDTTPPTEPVEPNPLPIDTQPYIDALAAFIASQLPTIIADQLP